SLDRLNPVTTLQLEQILPNQNSSFHGRVFLRSDYSKNEVYDDVSEQFNGISSSFTLKVSGINTTGIKTDNGIVLINNTGPMAINVANHEIFKVSTEWSLVYCHDLHANCQSDARRVTLFAIL
ncbi:MAG: hypothetical protein ACO3AZ_05965, partial [Ilumatobacteraceae bacterium]